MLLKPPTLPILLCLLVSPVVSSSIDEKASFALTHLKSLSDSGVYETLTLKTIVSSESSPGAFYQITQMVLELGSPVFQSGRETEEFTFLVLDSLEEGDKARSKSAIAIARVGMERAASATSKPIQSFLTPP